MVLWAYLTALDKTKAWPQETEGTKRSVNELLALLCEFEYDKFDDPHPDDEPCTDKYNCDVNFNRVVTEAINLTRTQFDGLCLGKIVTTTLGNALLTVAM